MDDVARDVYAQLVAGPELAVIVPTFKEVKNVPELVERLRQSLVGISWEVIFVDDDSPDGTSDCVREIARLDWRVRCLQRIDRRGLSSATIEGMHASSSPFLAVMDGDMQHDEQLLPDMLHALKSGNLDVVVGSRYVEGGTLGDFAARRVGMSKFATRLSRLVVPPALTDPMSGFFLIRREVFTAANRKMSAIGFKVLVDLFASSPRPLRFLELPYEFRTRRAGESKLDSAVVWDFGLLLIDKTVGHIVPARFFAFTVVGLFGVVVHLSVLAALLNLLHWQFSIGQALATGVAMIVNFSINNAVTYSDKKLRGWRWFGGLLSFAAVCGIGALANVGVASYLFRWRAAWIPAALAGILVSAVWNYVATSIFTWAKPGRR
ncbi:MAG TPA: glycosyltransferase family 2 protein [Steroidobacteraceae bacterium]|jgi:dolichol-phosphate mannosyltransferase|nr:glycosyltransferase family 2 protein [Steroidobacteraceae bacterium]